MDPGLRIVEDDLSGEAIQELLRLHAEGMLANSPKDACHFFDLDALRVPEVTLWSIWDGDDLAGCGALYELDPTHGEVKSMRTAAGYLGRGIGRRLLDHIVTTACDRGYRRLSLETGRSEGFAAAIRLYETAGFTECGPYGDYVDNDFSRFFTLDLTGPVNPQLGHRA
jgi:putative acetyltransferase